MGKHRFLYLTVLIFAAFFYVVYPRWFSWYFLVLMILLPLFDLIISVPGALSLRILLSVPYQINKGENGVAVITFAPRKPFPVGQIKGNLYAKQDSKLKKQHFRSTTSSDGSCEFPINTAHCGITTIELSRLWATGLLGLWAIPLTASRRASTLVLPPPSKPPNAVSLPRTTRLRPKPGGGFSEEHDIRPYREGDKLNSVHWKLSAKFDDLIVREALIPPTSNHLVRCADWSTQAECELILSRLRWISEYLLGSGTPYYLQFGDNGSIVGITAAEDLPAYLHRTLVAFSRAVNATAAVPPTFTQVFRIDAKEAAQ